MRNVLTRFGFVLAVSLPLLAPASAPDTATPDAARFHEWQNRIVQQLIQQGTADTLTTAAMMLPASQDMYGIAIAESRRKNARNKLAARRLQLLGRAADTAPDAADIAAMALQVCTSVPGCNVAAHAERLHRAAPDDAGYLLPALADAQSRQDSDKVSAILESMADARSFSTWYPSMRQRVQRAMKSIVVPALPSPPPAEFRERHPDLDTAEMSAMLSGAMTFAFAALPEYGTLTTACKKDGNAFAARQSACRQIGVALSHDNSLIGAKIGLLLWRRSALDKADQEAAADATRALEWQQEFSAEMMLNEDIDPIESYQATLHNGGEIPGVIALLRKHGVATQPPAGWVSRAELRRQQGQSQTHSTAASEVCSGTP